MRMYKCKVFAMEHNINGGMVYDALVFFILPYTPQGPHIVTMNPTGHNLDPRGFEIYSFSLENSLKRKSIRWFHNLLNLLNVKC